MNRLRAIGEWLFDKFLLLRPAVHNRIAWAVVIGGLAVFTSRWWEPLFLSLLTLISGQTYTIEIPPASLAPWAVALCGLGLVYQLVASFVYERASNLERSRRLTEINEHDIRVFKVSDGLMPESFLERFLCCLETNHSYRESMFEPVKALERRLEEEHARFLSPKLDGLAGDLRDAFDNLHNFLAHRFFVYPQHAHFEDANFSMQPCWNRDSSEWNGDPNSTEYYDDLSTELFARTETVRTAYRKFRRAVKSDLLI
jgi:hypothetical protein